MKVNNAQVCLDCEELFVGDTCPKCAGTKYFYLRQYYAPMFKFGGPNETVTVNPDSSTLPETTITISNPTIAYFTDVSPDVPNDLRAYDEALARQQSRYNEDCFLASSKSTPDREHYSRGKLMEAVISLLKGCNWSYAGKTGERKDGGA